MKVELARVEPLPNLGALIDLCIWIADQQMA